MAICRTVLALPSFIGMVLLFEASAGAVCAPAADPDAGLLVLDMSGEVRRGFADACGAAGEVDAAGAAAQPMLFTYVGELDEGPASPPSPGSDLGMWASLAAGLGLASHQMRRRRGMQVVSS